MAVDGIWTATEGWNHYPNPNTPRLERLKVTDGSVSTIDDVTSDGTTINQSFYAILPSIRVGTTQFMTQIHNCDTGAFIKYKYEEGNRIILSSSGSFSFPYANYQLSGARPITTDTIAIGWYRTTGQTRYIMKYSMSGSRIGTIAESSSSTLSTSPRTMAVANHREIWIRNGNQLAKFDHFSLNQVTLMVSDTLSGPLTQVHSSGDGGVWVLTSDQVLHKLDSIGVTQYTIKTDNVVGLGVETSTFNVWALDDTNNTLIKYHRATGTPLVTITSVHDNRIFMDEDNYVYTARQSGSSSYVKKYDGNGVLQWAESIGNALWSWLNNNHTSAEFALYNHLPVSESERHDGRLLVDLDKYTIELHYEDGGNYYLATTVIGDVGAGQYADGSKILYWRSAYTDHPVETLAQYIKIKAIPRVDNTSMATATIQSVEQLSEGDGTGDRGDIKVEFTLM